MTARDYESAAELARDIDDLFDGDDGDHLAPVLLPTRNFLRRIAAGYVPGPYTVEPVGLAWVVRGRDDRAVATCPDEVTAGRIAEALWLAACTVEAAE